MNLSNYQNRVYKLILVIILTTSMVYNYSLMFSTIDTSTLDRLVIISLAGFYIIFKFIIKNINYYNVIVIFLFLILCFVIKNKELMLLCTFCIAYLQVKPQDVIDVYMYSLGATLVINFLYAIINNNIHNIQGEGFSFGFSNQNTTSFFLALFLILLIIHRSKPYGNFRLSLENICFLLIGLVLNIVFFNDLTVSIFLIVFLTLNLISPKFFDLKITKFLVIIVPFLLIFLTLFLANNYNPLVNWMVKCNDLLSGRLNIWNYYFSRMPIQLISHNELFVISWGINYTPHQGAFDGSYAYLLYVFGYLFSALYVCGLSLCNYKLIKYKKYSIFVLLIALELVGFSENQMFSYACSFTSIFALLSFHKDWLIEKRS